jgi:predicted RNA methylase
MLKNFLHVRPPEFGTTILKTLVARLPTQTWLSREQIVKQQFSTPPAIAYFLSYLLILKPGDQILEPSAGTGSLAVWVNGLGLKTYTNEIDLRRRQLLEVLGFQPTAYNAEFINDLLAPDCAPDCVLMNPPFSSNGGRTKNNSSKFGFRHVESALERLKKGGKFGIILGEAGGLDTKTGNVFWRKLSDRIEVKSIIKIDGREYFKYGTTARINLITGRKFLETRDSDWNQALNKIITLSVSSVEEAFAKTDKLNLRFDY